MGYTTDFMGAFNLDRVMAPAHAKYLTNFNCTRRMKRDIENSILDNDPVREAAGLSLGKEGGYYVGSKKDGNYGQDKDTSILEYNIPPRGQPGLWCGWTVGERGDTIEWDGGEKFYSYVEWLEYILEHFLIPWGYKLNGSVTFQGESIEDRGKILVRDNKVTVETLE